MVGRRNRGMKRWIDFCKIMQYASSRDKIRLKLPGVRAYLFTICKTDVMHPLMGIRPAHVHMQ